MSGTHPGTDTGKTGPEFEGIARKTVGVELTGTTGCESTDKKRAELIGPVDDRVAIQDWKDGVRDMVGGMGGAVILSDLTESDLQAIKEITARLTKLGH